MCSICLHWQIDAGCEPPDAVLLQSYQVLWSGLMTLEGNLFVPRKPLVEGPLVKDKQYIFHILVFVFYLVMHVLAFLPCSDTVIQANNLVWNHHFKHVLCGHTLSFITGSLSHLPKGTPPPCSLPAQLLFCDSRWPGSYSLSSRDCISLGACSCSGCFCRLSSQPPWEHIRRQLCSHPACIHGKVGKAVNRLVSEKTPASQNVSLCAMNLVLWVPWASVTSCHMYS